MTSTREPMAEVKVTDAQAKNLRAAIATACNDDVSEPLSKERRRHVARIDAMSAAAEALEAASIAPVGGEAGRVAELVRERFVYVKELRTLVPERAVETVRSLIARAEKAEAFSASLQAKFDRISNVCRGYDIEGLSMVETIDAIDQITRAILSAHPAQSDVKTGVAVKALEWLSEPPYSVARVPQLALHYATECVWSEGKFLYCILSGASFFNQSFETLAEAKAAAQTDYERRILAALSPAPEPSVETLRTALTEARPYVEMVVKDEFHDLGLGHDAATLAKIDAALSPSDADGGAGK